MQRKFDKVLNRPILSFRVKRENMLFILLFPKAIRENAADPQTGAARNQESRGKVRRGPAVRSFQVRRGVAAAAEDGRVDCRKD